MFCTNRYKLIVCYALLNRDGEHAKGAQGNEWEPEPFICYEGHWRDGDIWRALDSVFGLNLMLLSIYPNGTNEAISLIFWWTQYP